MHLPAGEYDARIELGLGQQIDWLLLRWLIV
ncbi:MAG: stage II sporulation protein R [Burkholderiaceae bacterium]|nr:stage II sporulation protein R [Burkholderiaceae bacterium]